jgi:hypothetical protein
MIYTYYLALKNNEKALEKAINRALLTLFFSKFATKYPFNIYEYFRNTK